MFGRVVLLLCVLSTTNSWILEVNKNPVTPKTTTNVTITCHHDNDDIKSPIFSELYRIRITKFIDKKEWTTVAEMKVGDPVVMSTLVDAMVTGKVEKLSDSYIKIDFNIATVETVGLFVCEVDGVDELRKLKVITTKPVIVEENKEKISNEEILNILLDIKNQDKKHNTDLQNGFEMLKKSMDLLEVKNNGMSNSIKNITSRVDIINNDLEKLQKNAEVEKEADERVSLTLGDVMNQVKTNHADHEIAANQRMNIENVISIAAANFTDELKSFNQEYRLGAIEMKHDLGTLNDLVVSKFDDEIKTINKNNQQAEEERKMIESLINLSFMNITSQINVINNDHESASNQRRMNQKIIALAFKSVNKKINKMADNVLDVIGWPVGKYTLLKADTGCPESIHSPWQFSSVKISTAPGSKNGDKGSKVFNLAGDVFQHVDDKNYVNLEMCSMVADDVGWGVHWPKGTYCIQPYSYNGKEEDTNCPTGFKFGSIHFGRYDDGKQDDIVNLPGYEKKNDKSNTRIHFCCRDDSKMSSPIILPKRHPFYLYRYGKDCQQVDGMQYDYQYILLDTGKWGKNNRNADVHPYDWATDNHVGVGFCHYTTDDVLL